MGLGLITGAADDDPSVIVTYASAGATLRPSFLWTAPVKFPMMFAVVYLSARRGQVSRQGPFVVLRIGNTIEAGADLGGIASAVNLVFHVPVGLLVVVIAAAILAIQILGSYVLMRNLSRVLALALLAYVPAAILAKPDL